GGQAEHLRGDLGRRGGDGVPADVRGAQERAGRRGEVDLGELVIDDRGDLIELGGGEAGGGVEHVGAGGGADVELALLGLELAGGEDGGLAGGEDAFPAGLDAVYGLGDLLA